MSYKDRRRKSSAGTDLPNAARNARQIAFAVLREYQRSSVFVHQLLDDRFDCSSDSKPAERERRLATEIVFGVLRRRATLNAVIRHYLQRPRGRVENDLWNILQIGAYQLLFLDAVPAHAAVHETVELTQWCGKKRWSGFVNGILRAIERDLTDERVARPARSAVPLNGPGYRVLRRDVFPEPSHDPVGYFSQAFSFPQWLAQRWNERMGTEELIRVGGWFNAPPRMCIRPNSLRTTCEELLQLFESRGITGTSQTIVPGAKRTASDKREGKTKDRCGVWLPPHTSVSALPGYQDGLFSVQDLSAMQAPLLLATQPGETVWDLCAAPGTKTTLLAEIMQNQGCVVATDVSRERLEKVDENCRRLGTTIVTTQTIGAEGRGLPDGPFDAVLVDAPCSNTGVLGKRPEARWRIRMSDVRELAAIQQRLLQDAVSRVRSGGRIVYSTCSIEPEENQQVVASCVRQNHDVSLVAEVFHVPGQPADGAYQALLVRD